LKTFSNARTSISKAIIAFFNESTYALGKRWKRAGESLSFSNRAVVCSRIFNSSGFAEEADFAASPHRVYEALLDEKQFSRFTGAPARINRTEGGALSLFGGAILARNLAARSDEDVEHRSAPLSRIA